MAPQRTFRVNDVYIPFDADAGDCGGGTCACETQCNQTQCDNKTCLHATLCNCTKCEGCGTQSGGTPCTTPVSGDVCELRVADVFDVDAIRAAMSQREGELKSLRESHDADLQHIEDRLRSALDRVGRLRRGEE